MEKLAHGHAAQILDLLSGRLAFERNGVRLYDNVIRKITAQNESRYHRILDQLQEIRVEEKEHEEWLEAQIRSLGGTAHETTAMSQLETEESRGIESVIVDGHQNVMHLLHALLAAELSDNAGWDLLVKLAAQTGDREAKLQFLKRLGEEAKHLAFIREAVIRATEFEVLGRSTELPTSTGAAMARSFTRPGAIAAGLGALLFGAGAATAGGLLMARPGLFGLAAARKLRILRR